MSASGLNMRVLYVGDITEGGTCRQRMQALLDLGCQVTAVHTNPPEAQLSTLVRRVRQKLFGLYDAAGVNEQILAHAAQKKFDVLWLDKALTVMPETLARMRTLQPDCRILGYSPDDMAAPHNHSPQFLAHLKYYSVFFTTKSYGVGELKQLGCPAVEFIGNAYDEHTHRPLEVNEANRARLGGPVGFIGTWEADRGNSMLALARAGITVRIWGNGWSQQRRRDANMLIERRAVYGDEYALAISAFDINLTFLRKINRDQQTQRSVEIPACGAFMLAERTDEHCALFEEGKEADYFDSDAELISKVRYYVDHPEERRRIAQAGRERCLRDGYSYRERLATMLREFAGMRSTCNA
ncbi:MAG TPA: glycosyltransferase [Planctomycetota bacterium]|nr:glycosyltransferase [Planctomycetota bacterium]